MNAAHAFLLALIPFTLVVSAVCSASETALFTLGHNDRLRLRRQHPGAARAVAALLARPRKLLITILVFNTIANTAFYVASSLLGYGLSEGWLAVLITVIAPAVLLLCGEVLPKTLASIHRVWMARFIAGPLLATSRVAAPLMNALDRGVVAPLTRLVRPRGSDHPEPVGAEELSALVELGAGQGLLDEDEERLLAEVVELGRLRVRDVMTPRGDIRWVHPGDGPAEVAEVVRRSGRARLPVFETGPDEESLGWLMARRYLAACASGGEGAEPPLREFIEPVRYVPERITLDQLLDHFRATRTHIALCVDEHGSVTGLIEVSDAVKGLIRSRAAAEAWESEQARKLGPGEWILPGRLSVREWAPFLERAGGDAGVLDARVSTLGGLLLARLGRLPRAGDSVSIGNVRLRVEAMRDRAIESVRVSLIGPGDDAVARGAGR